MVCPVLLGLLLSQGLLRKPGLPGSVSGPAGTRAVVTQCDEVAVMQGWTAQRQVSIPKQTGQNRAGKLGSFVPGRVQGQAPVLREAGLLSRVSD